jgi:hypothetical protein
LKQRLPLVTTVILSLVFVTGFAARAAAEDAPVLKERTLFETPRLHVTFPSASLAAQTATAAATTNTNGTNDHQFGVGLRLSAEHGGIGAGVRYFFYGGPLGVQAEISRFGVDMSGHNFDSVRFAPSVIYRFVEQKFNGPVSLMPYAGGGLSFVHSNFDEAVFGTGTDDTSLGVLLFGGVEIFFTKIPPLSVSGELTFASNDDVSSSFGTASLGGITFTASGHWYFW